MIKVGVIRGGADNTYDSSLASGASIISLLRNQKLSSDYFPIDIFIDKDGIWHMGGIPTTPSKVAENVDVVFNALHGDSGQNEGIQKILEENNIPYTGSDSNAYFLTSDRATVKEELAKVGINTPGHILYSAYLKDLDGTYEDYAENRARGVINRLPPPWVVKPLTRGSSMGTFVCRTSRELIDAIIYGAHEKVSILIEEMIEGMNVSVSVVNNFRGKNVYPLLCLGDFSSEQKREVERLAALAHETLKLRHYSQSNFIVTPKKEIYLVELDAYPKLSVGSSIHKHLDDIGSSSIDFIKHIIEQAKL